MSDGALIATNNAELQALGTGGQIVIRLGSDHVLPAAHARRTACGAFAGPSIPIAAWSTGMPRAPASRSARHLPGWGSGAARRTRAAADRHQAEIASSAARPSRASVSGRAARPRDQVPGRDAVRDVPAGVLVACRPRKLAAGRSRHPDQRTNAHDDRTDGDHRAADRDRAPADRRLGLAAMAGLLLPLLSCSRGSIRWAGSRAPPLRRAQRRLPLLEQYRRNRNADRAGSQLARLTRGLGDRRVACPAPPAPPPTPTPDPPQQPAPPARRR
jgi:hypothetical protein